MLHLAKDFFGIRDPQGGPQIRPVARVEEARFQPGVLNVLDLHNVDPEVLRRSFGPRGTEALSDADRRHLGGAALDYIRMGIELASTGQVDGLATLPVTKEDIALVEPGFRGHTEFLGERLGTLTGSGQVTIVLVHGNLRVLHVTLHIPLQEVGRRFADPAIIQRILELIEIADRMGRQFYGLSQPRIGVLGLNPHAGEGGLMGTEDRERILPAIEEARSRGLRVEGPIPGDAAFVPGIRDQYDFLLAMYHDQGHAPFKAIAGHGAINFTGNLTVVRTTPDHGTARKLAWNLDRPFPLSTAGTVASIRSATQMTALQRKPPAAGMEEVVQALEKLFDAAPGSLGPEVLVFTEPETFDLVPLALRWGRKVAVLSDAPEAEALRELLESMPAQFPAGSYAIGYVPASRFLENVRQIWVESEAHGLRLLRLPPELGDLPEPVAQLLQAVHRVLAAAVSA